MVNITLPSAQELYELSMYGQVVDRRVREPSYSPGEGKVWGYEPTDRGWVAIDPPHLSPTGELRENYGPGKEAVVAAVIGPGAEREEYYSPFPDVTPLPRDYAPFPALTTPTPGAGPVYSSPERIPIENAEPGEVEAGGYDQWLQILLLLLFLSMMYTQPDYGWV